MDDETTRMSIRLPDALYARLKRAAVRDHRSAHAQMLAYIERCLDEDESKIKEEETRS